jgi:hypothetical protein
MTPVTHKTRVTDIEYEDAWKLWSGQYDRIEFYKKSLARARELGMNVAKALMTPIEDVEYLGEESGVSCPVCHSNILLVHEDLPYVACPICWIRGEICSEGNKMKIQWNENDARNPRFSYEADNHHQEWLGKHYFQNQEYFKTIHGLTKEHRKYGNIIKPEKS